MKWLMTGVAAVALLIAVQPAEALVADGITYTLTENSISADTKTAFFTLTISGENTASDTEGGRTGINAFAFTTPTLGTITGGTVTAPPNFNFVLGGLNSSGCDGNGGFYCFDNTTIPPTPATNLSGTITINFNVTDSTAGAWANYAPDFKIDWVGSKNNYDLVSLPIAVNTGTNPPPPPPPPPPPGTVAEPGSLAELGTGLLAMTGMLWYRRRNNQR